MGILSNIKSQLGEFEEEEQEFEKDIESGDLDRVKKEYLQLLKEIEALDEEFIYLLLSDNAEDDIMAAEEIVEWEEEVVEFLISIQDNIRSIEREIERSEDPHEEVSKLRRKTERLREDREEMHIDKDQAKEAVMLFLKTKDIGKELEWFEKAVKALERDQKALTSAFDEYNVKRDISDKQLSKIERTVPELESHVRKLQGLKNRQDEVFRKISDLPLDTYIEVLESCGSTIQEDKREIEHILAMIDQIENITLDYKDKSGHEDTSSRRDVLKDILKIAGGLGGAGAAARRSGRLSQLAGAENSYKDGLNEGKVGLDGLDVKYKMEMDEGDIGLLIKYTNVSDRFLAIEALLEVPKHWDLQNYDLVSEGDVKSGGLYDEFNITPEDHEEARIFIGNANRGPNFVPLDLKWETEGGRSKEKTVKINMPR